MISGSRPVMETCSWLLDVHKAQKTPKISHTLEQSNTNVVYLLWHYIPKHSTGCGLFKAAVGRLATQHFRITYMPTYRAAFLPLTDECFHQVGCSGLEGCFK